MPGKYLYSCSMMHDRVLLLNYWLFYDLLCQNVVRDKPICLHVRTVHLLVYSSTYCDSCQITCNGIITTIITGHVLPLGSPQVSKWTFIFAGVYQHHIEFRISVVLDIQIFSL